MDPVRSKEEKEAIQRDRDNDVISLKLSCVDKALRLPLSGVDALIEVSDKIYNFVK